MADKEKYKKQKKDKKRYEILRNFMASFTLTAIVVVAVVTRLPKSPVASIENVNIFENQIVYQILVTDEEQALDLSSLKVVLDGQLEDFEYPLELGVNVGVFENLTSNTSYKLEVYGSKGFGDEKLVSMRVETKASSNGAIVSYELVDTFDFFFDYEVKVIYEDINNLFSEVNLYYTYLYPDEEPQFYDVVTITSSNQSIILGDVPNEHTRVHLYLEATLISGEDVVLDELTFYIPFELSTYLYLDQKTNHSVTYQFYEDYYFTNDIEYVAYLYFGYMLVDESEIVQSEVDMHHGSLSFSFSNLKKETLYKVIVKAKYIDPHTLREEIIMIHEEEFTTLADYTIEYEVTEFDTYFEVYIHLNDPNHFFQVPYYTIYEIIDGSHHYDDSQTFDFTPDENGKSISFNISKPDLDYYQIVIGVRNQTDQTINHIIFDQNIEK